MKKFRLIRNKPENWILKAVSLCLAIMLWYFVVGEDQVDVTINVPIEILNLPAELTISNNFKKDIEVSVRGPRSLVTELRSRNISRPVNLSDAKPGTIVVKNDENSIPFPKGITVQRLQPPNITLLLDELIQKNYPINPIVEGELALGFELQHLYLDPDHLVISGPKNILEKDLALETYVINLDGLDQSTTLQVHLNLDSDFLNLIGEAVVTARLDVREKSVEKKVKNIPVNVRDASIPVTIEPDSITVIASIPQNLISETPELSMLFRVSVATNDITEAKELPVNVNGVNVPGHDPIKILSVKPEKVLVTPVQTTR